MHHAIKWTFLLASLLLVACSNAPSIYLNERYLTDGDVAAVRTKLSEQGFNVKTVNIPFPSGVASSTLMYSPLLSAEKTLDTVVESLEQEGYSSLTVIPLKQGNHLYKQNSVGLYLLAPGVQSLAASKQIFAHQYHSDGCRSESSLKLKRNKTFIYHIDGAKLAGRWEIPDMPYLHLYNKQPYINFYYRISTDTQSDNLGEVEVTTLTPMTESPNIAGCRMFYGIRQ